MLLYHAEIVYRDGVAVGDIRAASFGHTLNGAVGLVMVEARDKKSMTAEAFLQSTWEVRMYNI